MMNPYKEKIIPLGSDRRFIYALKKAGIECFHPRGAYNGYGYVQLPMAARITSLSEMRKYNKIKREIEACSTVPSDNEIPELSSILSISFIVPAPIPGNV